MTAPSGLMKHNTSDMITFLEILLFTANPISEVALLMEKVFFKDEKSEMNLGYNMNYDREYILLLSPEILWDNLLSSDTTEMKSVGL